jgi:hypothetical protein
MASIGEKFIKRKIYSLKKSILRTFTILWFLIISWLFYTPKTTGKTIALIFAITAEIILILLNIIRNSRR